MKRPVVIFLSVLFFLMPGIKAGSQLEKGEGISSNEPLEIDTIFRQDYRTAFEMIYAELKDIKGCNIKIKGKRLKTTMASRPTFLSFFRKKDKRRYVIVFNNDPAFEGVQLNEVPEQARIGLFAHELMHIRDYQQQNFGGLVKRGWQYLSKRGKRNLEHRIDSMTIAAGFGKNLYRWSYFVLNSSSASEEYKVFKLEIYMTPEAILDHLRLYH